MIRVAAKKKNIRKKSQLFNCTKSCSFFRRSHVFRKAPNLHCSRNLPRATFTWGNKRPSRPVDDAPEVGKVKHNFRHTIKSQVLWAPDGISYSYSVHRRRSPLVCFWPCCWLCHFAILLFCHFCCACEIPRIQGC